MKILFITTRNPYAVRFSGDVMRASRIIKLLRNKYNTDVLFIGKKNYQKGKRNTDIEFNDPNFFYKIYYCLISLFKLEPIQFGLFHSPKLKHYIKQNAGKYDVLFFHHIRSTQYFPKSYKGKTILEMGDLYSQNYLQTQRCLSIFNPLFYCYLIESFLIKGIEEKSFNLFKNIILFSKKEIELINKSYRKKIVYIPESAKKILPKISLKFPEIEFHIIGDISKLSRYYFYLNSKVKILGQKKNLEKYIKDTICGLANLKIASGVQGKVLTYMSLGFPTICSKKVATNFDLATLKYKNKNELISQISDLKRIKYKSELYSRKSQNFIKNFLWKKISLEYLKLINNSI